MTCTPDQAASILRLQHELELDGARIIEVDGRPWDQAELLLELLAASPSPRESALQIAVDIAGGSR